MIEDDKKMTRLVDALVYLATDEGELVADDPSYATDLTIDERDLFHRLRRIARLANEEDIAYLERCLLYVEDMIADRE